MNSTQHCSEKRKQSRSLDELKLQHISAIRSASDWQSIWELFYRNRWFRQTLLISARKAVRRAGLRPDCVDDVRQEALFEFSKSLQRRKSLGFDPDRGNFASFVGIIVRRCCLKALRQFRHQYLSLREEEFFHPYYEEHSQLEKVMDLRKVARELPEPYRGIVRQVVAGKSVSEIAASRSRSKRTIYRWIDRSIELMKQQCLDDS